MPRKVTDEQLREIVRSRITKGSAFSCKGGEYAELQERTKSELADMSRAEIVAKYPNAVYDIR